MYECRIGIHAVTLVDYYYYNSEFMYISAQTLTKETAEICCITSNNVQKNYFWFSNELRKICADECD